MITRIDLRFGSGPSQPPLSFAPGPCTVFVGPNYSGKSIMLHELGSALVPGQHHEARVPGLVRVPPDSRRIVASADRMELTWQEVKAHLVRGPDGSLTPRPILNSGMVGGSLRILEGQVAEIEAGRGQAALAQLAEFAVAAQMAVLDGKSRLNLVDQQAAGSYRLPPQNHLQALLLDDQRRGTLRNAIHDAFGLYAFLDPTHSGQIQICVGKVLPDEPDYERSFTDKALEFFSRTLSIRDTSDGVKAYTGILAALLCRDCKVVLIDEPEAFLHPTLSRRLGQILATLASDREGNVLASTHSSDFLMGCIQAGKPVNIVRLTYGGEDPTARLLPYAQLEHMMRDPLLRSTGVLNALFYQGAIVCEGDTDRAFYEEINERLLRFGCGGGDDCVYLNAQNWQTEGRLIHPLRNMGIPAAAVADLDVLVSDQMSDLMSAAFVPPILISSWGTLRSKLNESLKSQFKHLADPDRIRNHVKQTIKANGLSSLPQEDREAAEMLLRDLREYGVFVVPVGELERWLAGHGISDHGSRWLLSIFERMGCDPAGPDYLRPASDDVWAFVRGINAWIENPKRKGLPS